MHHSRQCSSDLAVGNSVSVVRWFWVFEPNWSPVLESVYFDSLGLSCTDLFHCQGLCGGDFWDGRFYFPVWGAIGLPGRRARCSNSHVPTHFWTVSDVKWGPLSLMTWSGHPYLAKRLFNLQSSCPNSLTAWSRYADSSARTSSDLRQRSKKLPLKKYRNSSQRRLFLATTSLLVT